MLTESAWHRVVFVVPFNGDGDVLFCKRRIYIYVYLCV